MRRMICWECATKRKLTEEYDRSILRSLDSPCMLCGEDAGLSEVDVPTIQSRYQLALTPPKRILRKQPDIVDAIQALWK